MGLFSWLKQAGLNQASMPDKSEFRLQGYVEGFTQERGYDAGGKAKAYTALMELGPRAVSATDALLDYLWKTESPVFQEMTIEILGAIGQAAGEKAATSLIQVLDANVAETVGGAAGEEAVKIALKGRSMWKNNVRAEAAKALGEFGEVALAANAMPFVLKATQDRNEEVANAARDTLVRLGRVRARVDGIQAKPSGTRLPRSAVSNN